MASIRKLRDKYQVQIRHLGMRPISRSFLQRKDAEQWARQMELLADRHELPDDPSALKRVTLGELVERYRDSITVRKRRAHVERVELDAFLRAPICSKPLSELSTADFAAYRDERLASVKPTTVKRQLGPIRHLFKIARDEWNIPIRQNPLDRLQLDAPDQRRNRRLKGGELERIVEASRRSRNKLILPIVLLALETGMRRGEILAAKGSDLDLDNQTLVIPTSKNGHSRTIPLSPKAIELLRAFSTTDDRLFPISGMALRLAWERLRRRAGIADLHFHDLRHEAISRFFEKGLTVPEVALLSGHRDPRMLFRYAHGRPENVLRKLQE